MICKNCETENPEEAVYCKNCGKRLDGKVICPSCGHENPEDANVCTMCGTRIAAENGTPSNSAPAKEKTAGGWKKWVELAGGISAMVAVFCVLLCTFLVGIGASYGGRTMQGHDIWYYFGDIWKTIQDADLEGMAEIAVYMQAVYGIIISVGMIISTLVFSILAAVRFGNKTAGKSEKDYFKYALGAVMSFICGTALIVALDAASGDGVSIIPNAAGLAGIILGVLLLAGCIACRLTVKGKELVTKQSIMQLAFTAGALVLLSIAVAFAAKPAVGQEGEFFSFFYWAGVLGGMSGYADGLEVPFALSLVAMTIQIAAIILGISAIGSRLKNLAAEKPNSGLKSSIWLTVISSVFVIFAVSALAVSANTLDMDTGFNYAYIIVEFVFAALSIVVAAVYRALALKKKNA